jgi:hypothetical protein
MLFWAMEWQAIDYFVGWDADLGDRLFSGQRWDGRRKDRNGPIAQLR